MNKVFAMFLAKSWLMSLEGDDPMNCSLLLNSKSSEEAAESVLQLHGSGKSMCKGREAGPPGLLKALKARVTREARGRSRRIGLWPRLPHGSPVGSWDLDGAFVCWGCCSQVPQTGWSGQRNLTVSQLWGLDVQGGQGSAGLVPAEDCEGESDPGLFLVLVVGWASLASRSITLISAFLYMTFSLSPRSLSFS